jgi:hypothetical protein
MAIKYTKTKNIPTASIARPSQIYPNLDFWFENVVSYYLATLHFNCNAPTAFSGTKFVMPT